MKRSEVEGLDPRCTYWVPAVVAPCRDWPGAPGSRRGSRYLLDDQTLRPNRQQFPAFDSRVGCLEWIMSHRAELARSTPDAKVVPVNLARWLLGLD